MSITKLLKKIDHFLDQQTALLILLLIVVVLRIPNFFEPYWYGDEAIYLSLGNALNKGGALYTTIIDHKTPLIYYLARVPNQFYFRLLNLGWMLATTTAFMAFVRRLFKKELPSFLAGLMMVLLTSLPWLEGHIPNGELFVMGFVMVGALIFSYTQLWQNFFAKKIVWGKNKLKEGLLLLVSGMFFSLGILTKVPALLDVASFLAIFFLIIVGELFKDQLTLKKAQQTIGQVFWRAGIFGAGILLPIILSVVYFNIIGSGKDYLDYGLLYNIRYSQSWQHDFGSNFLNFSFSLLGKTLYLATFGLLITLNTNSLKRRFQFISIWFMAALYSVLLSSRPYPHYFIQMVPPFAMLIIEIIKQINHNREPWLNKLKVGVSGVALLSLVAYIMLAFNFRPYSTTKYYRQFWRLASGTITKEEYDNSFDYLVRDNRQVVKLIKEMSLEKIFIWGTNPMLYAESQTVPTSRFTVAFHIKDFKDYDRTFAQIETDQPKLIVVMKNETQAFPALENYLRQHYLLNTELESMSLYLRK